MKKFLLFFKMLLLVAVPSCKKEVSCEECKKNNKPPIAIAGLDQAITLPTDSILLDGTASSDADGTISVWLWTKISGPASFDILKPADSTTLVKSLTAGTYHFELKVTDDKGLSGKDTVQIILADPLQPNRPPFANAGADQTITLPTNSVTVNGNGSGDPDNNMTSYLWTKIAGPSSFNIVNTAFIQTQINNLTQGIYQFELKVGDAGGLFSKDSITVTVLAPPPTIPPCDNSNRPLINAQLVPFGTLSRARIGMAVASAGNKILFAGGLGLSGSGASSVDIYDISNNTWSTAELCVGRYMIAATSVGSKIFFGGGEVGDGTWPVDSVDIYDVNTNTWTVGHLSTSGNSIAAAAVGNKVFFAGGDPGFSGAGRGSRVDIFDINSNTWSTASLTEAKYGISAVTLNSRIYFSGGFNFSSSSKKIEIYDNATNSWSLDEMYEKKSHHGGIAAGDKIFWAGGLGNSPDPYTCQVEIKNVNTGNSSIEYLFRPAGWSSFDGQHLLMKNNKIIFLSAWGTDMDKFDIYDLATNTWSVGILPQGIPQGSSFISVNNTIYIAGGSQVWKLEF